MKKLTCQWCQWFYNTFQGKTCGQRFGVVAKTKACDEFDHFIPLGLIYYKASSDPTKPQFAYLESLGEINPNQEPEIILTLMKAEWVEGDRFVGHGWQPVPRASRIRYKTTMYPAIKMYGVDKVATFENGNFAITHLPLGCMMGLIDSNGSIWRPWTIGGKSEFPPPKSAVTSRAAHWVDQVDTKWSPPEGFFLQSAQAIALGLKAASKDLDQAMSRLNFYINRAGKNLSPLDKRRLELAKTKLQKLY